MSIITTTNSNQHYKLWKEEPTEKPEDTAGFVKKKLSDKQLEDKIRWMKAETAMYRLNPEMRRYVKDSDNWIATAERDLERRRLAHMSGGNVSTVANGLTGG